MSISYLSDVEASRSDINFKDPVRRAVVEWQQNFVHNCTHLQLVDHTDELTDEIKTKKFFCKLQQTCCNYKNCPAR